MDFGVPLSDLAWPVAMLAGAGFVLGIVAGLLGIGGGGILVPVFYEVFGILGADEAVRMHLSVGTSLAVIVPTSLRSFQAHRSRGAVDMALMRSFALPVVLGVGLGILVARISPGDVLKGVWVGAATIISLRLYLKREDWRLGDVIPGQPFRAVYGLFIGTISTLMSIGGGVFIMALMTLYGRPMHQAVGTSSGFGPLISIPGALGFAWAGWGAAGLPPGSFGYVSAVALVVFPISVLAAPLGVRLAHGISKRKLELAYATFLAFVGVRFLMTL